MIIRTIQKTDSAKRVAAYARVSTLAESQEESYETQVRYYTDYIGQAKDWSIVKVYADKGITGTSAEKRPGFMEMIRDAKARKIDLILCKSISRFSRNYEEAQRYTHLLKGLGVEVRFEKEGLSTSDPQTDMVLGTMMAVAQQESKSISENIRWAYKRLGEQGIRHVGNNHVLGYDEVDGEMVPNQSKWIIETIFQRYADGKSIPAIVKELNEKGAKTLRNGSQFVCSTVINILRNEVFVGDRLIEKTPSRNYLTKKADPTIERETNYVKDHHKPIITRTLWDAVQERLRQEDNSRHKKCKPRLDSHPYYGRVICAFCGQPFRRFTRKSKSGELFSVWKCSSQNKGECENRIIRETELEHMIGENQSIIVSGYAFEPVHAVS